MNLKGYIIPLVLGTAIGFGIWWQAKADVRLSEERSRIAEQSLEIARLKSLIARNHANAGSAAELQKLNGAATEANALRSRIEKLKEAQSQPLPSASNALKKKEERWRNLGQGTARDALHSVIWSATVGETDSLATLLAFDADSRVAADELFASIPPESRALFPSADILIATFIAGRLPTNFFEAQIIDQIEEGADMTKAKVRLKRSTRSDDPPRDVTFRFQRSGADWRLLVPKSVIAEFQRSLNGP
jgi:hypothetical protein